MSFSALCPVPPCTHTQTPSPAHKFPPQPRRINQSSECNFPVPTPPGWVFPLRTYPHYLLLPEATFQANAEVTEHLIPSQLHQKPSFLITDSVSAAWASVFPKEQKSSSQKCFQAQHHLWAVLAHLGGHFLPVPSLRLSPVAFTACRTFLHANGPLVTKLLEILSRKTRSPWTFQSDLAHQTLPRHSQM